MELVGDLWQIQWNSSDALDGQHHIRVRAKTSHEEHDEIVALVSQNGQYTPPPRNSIDYKNAIGAYPVKGILGTELGPNEKGTKGPWPSWRNR